MKPPPLDDPDFAPARADEAQATMCAIRDELADGERLIWIGQPLQGDAGVDDLPDALPAALGALAVLAGLCVAALGLLRGMPGVGLLGVILIIGGVALLGVGFVARLGHQARATSYAVTDRRVILREPLPLGKVRVRSVRPGDLGGMSRTERPDGSADIVLEIMGRLPDGDDGPIALARLRRIAGAREVEALIRATLFAD